MTELEIVGSPHVADNFTASYKAIAHYDSGRTEDVTDSTDWAVDDDQIATINENGILQTGPSSLPRDVTIYAEYAEGDITIAMEEMVSVMPICLEGSALDFNGTHDYVALGPPVLPMGNKSLFAWTKIPPVGSGDSHDYFIFWGLSRFYFDNGTTLRAHNIWSGGYDATYAVALDDDKWHYVGFTYDDTNTLRLYMDGVVVATDIGNDQHSIEHPACIGGHSDE
ncbi:MAG: LamG-like jellyroll fold domain-containing protein, partial [Planctomycetota bacterium]